MESMDSAENSYEKAEFLDFVFSRNETRFRNNCGLQLSVLDGNKNGNQIPENILVEKLKLFNL